MVTLRSVILYGIFILPLKGMAVGRPLETEKRETVVIAPASDSMASENRFSVKKAAGIALPAAMITYGLISLGDNGIRCLDHNIRNDLTRNSAFWYIRADNYMQFAPAVAAFAIKGFGVSSAHNWSDMTAIYLLSNALAGGIVYGTKYGVGRQRPDGSNNLSFPSGHTETAFVAAEFLHQEFKEKSVWISVAGYSAATFVGAARIMNNKHWLSDVVAGAGIGILSTKALYWCYPYLKKTLGKSLGNNSALLLPGYSRGRMVVCFSYRL